MSKQNNSDDVLGFGLGLGLGSGLVLGLGLLSGLVLVLGFGLVLGLVSGLVLVKDERYSNLFIIFYVSGLLIGGFIGYQQVQLQNLESPAPVQPPSTYQGTVEAIYANNPSFIEFTTGDKWYGNLSKISNLSIGSVCKIVQVLNASQAPNYGLDFTSGICYTR